MTKIVCPTCGSTNVYTQQWINLNTDESYNGKNLKLKEINDWCNDCVKYITNISEHMYKRKKGKQ